MRTADLSDQQTVLVVCFGNLCRSPMAEGLFRAALDRSGWRILSAGTHAVGGDPPTRGSRETAEGIGGIDISHLRSSPLTVGLLQESDHVFTMSRQQAREAAALLPSAAQRVRLLGAFVPDQGEANGPADPYGNLADASEIADPMGGDPGIYAACFERLRACVDVAARWLHAGAPTGTAPPNVADWLTRP
jgi:protein-tyrosine-phosphatase